MRQEALAFGDGREGGPAAGDYLGRGTGGFGSCGGEAKSRSSSDSRNATVPQRSQGRSRRQPRRKYPCPSTTLSMPTPDAELSFPRKREPSALSVFHVGR